MEVQAALFCRAPSSQTGDHFSSWACCRALANVACAGGLSAAALVLAAERCLGRRRGGRQQSHGITGDFSIPLLWFKVHRSFGEWCRRFPGGMNHFCMWAAPLISGLFTCPIREILNKWPHSVLARSMSKKRGAFRRSFLAPSKEFY